MSDTGYWRILNAAPVGVPQLLVRSCFRASGYDVNLTDLSHIWQTSATKEEIIKEASEIGSSLDPSQDDEQFNIFLSKIESAIDGENGTTLDIHAANDSESDLYIELSAKLPGSLPTFKWNLKLKLLPRHETERLLISPLLRQASQLQQQLQQLVSELHDKDRVISKICDRLETSGNDLTTVFPGVPNIKTNRKKGQREQLAKHVKGLADFDEGAWRTKTLSARDGGELDHNDINAVLNGLPSPAPDIKTERTSADWWKHLNDGTTGNANGTGTDRPINKPAERGQVQAEESMQDDEFQTQSTPPRLKQDDRMDGSANTDPVSSTTLAHQHDTHEEEGDESTTEDEDDLDAAPPPSQSVRAASSGVSQRRATSPPPRKLGTLGGRKAKSPSIEAHEPIPEPKPQSKLGTIGGKAKVSQSKSPQREVEPSVTATRPTKLGVIGGKKVNQDVIASPEDTSMETLPTEIEAEEERAARSSAKLDSPAPRENSAERADRKRDKLKRELEEKAKAPVKKKRKF